MASKKMVQWTLDLHPDQVTQIESELAVKNDFHKFECVKRTAFLRACIGYVLNRPEVIKEVMRHAKR